MNTISSGKNGIKNGKKTQKNLGKRTTKNKKPIKHIYKRKLTRRKTTKVEIDKSKAVV